MGFSLSKATKAPKQPTQLFHLRPLPQRDQHDSLPGCEPFGDSPFSAGNAVGEVPHPSASTDAHLRSLLPPAIEPAHWHHIGYPRWPAGRVLRPLLTPHRPAVLTARLAVDLIDRPAWAYSAAQAVCFDTAAEAAFMGYKSQAPFRHFPLNSYEQGWVNMECRWKLRQAALMRKEDAAGDGDPVAQGLDSSTDSLSFKCTGLNAQHLRAFEHAPLEDSTCLDEDEIRDSALAKKAKVLDSNTASSSPSPEDSSAPCVSTPPSLSSPSSPETSQQEFTKMPLRRADTCSLLVSSQLFRKYDRFCALARGAELGEVGRAPAEQTGSPTDWAGVSVRHWGRRTINPGHWDAATAVTVVRGLCPAQGARNLRDLAGHEAWRYTR